MKAVRRPGLVDAAGCQGAPRAVARRAAAAVCAPARPYPLQRHRHRPRARPQPPHGPQPCPLPVRTGPHRLGRTRFEAQCPAVATASRAGHCHQDLPALCERLRLPAPPSSHTKHQRLSASLQECSDDRLEHVTEAILDSEPFPAWERTQLQGVLWSGCPGPWLGATVRTGGAALGWSAGPVTVPGACASPVAHSWSTRERSVTFG